MPAGVLNDVYFAFQHARGRACRRAERHSDRQKNVCLLFLDLHPDLESCSLGVTSLQEPVRFPLALGFLGQGYRAAIQGLQHTRSPKATMAMPAGLTALNTDRLSARPQTVLMTHVFCFSYLSGSLRKRQN